MNKSERKSWKAPEHARMTSDMRRDSCGRLIVDPRPEILRKKEKAIRLF